MSISADFSSTSATASVSSFTTATQGMESASPSTSIEQFRISETIRIRERLAELNSQNLRQYFQGIRSLYDELLLKKEEYEVEAIVHQENMKELFQTSRNLKDQLQETRQKMEEGSSDLTRIDAEIKERIKKEAPELEEKINKLRELQKRLAYLQFTKTFTNLRDEIRRFLRKGNYQLLLDNYRRLLRIPSENPEYCLDSQCRRDYSVKSASLAQFLQLELRSTLTNVFSRIHFPFEESIDLNPLRPRLLQSAQILKCLKLVNIETLAAAAGADLGLKGEPQPEPLELVLGEFSRRFNFHFYGDKPTNVPTKPEWFFAQLSYWAENNLDYFEQFIQPVLDEMYPGTGTAKPMSAKDAFLQHLMQLASLKVRELLRLDNFAQDRRQLSHLIDECVLFEREMAESFGYANPAAADQSLDPQSAVHVVSELCQLDEVLETWIKLERDTLSAGMDAILADKEAYDPRYQEAADVDPYLVPNFADCFVILMQSMSERYRAIPDMRLQCRFLKLQLVIVDEFRSRIVQIGQSLQHNPFHTNFPQLMNALWYLIVVLEDWSDSHEFVRLQFSMQRLHSSESMATDSSTSLSSLARGTFDESASLYRHVWRQLVRSMCDAFAGKIRRRLAAYAAERWYDWDGTNRLPKPSDVTPSLEPFLRTVRELLGWIVANVSPDSVLTLHHLTNHEVWTVLDEEVISRTAFGYRGASQMLHDVTRALIPLLNHCYGKTKGAGIFDIYNEKCVQVLSSLRLLAMPPPAAILLKDELKHIPAHELDQKLEQFSVMGLTKARVMEVLEQRCDLGVLLDKLTT